MNQPLRTPIAADDEDAACSTAWTAQRVAMLHLHYLQGMTAADSALILGGVTRNSVISKRYRLGLFGRAAPSRPKLTRAPSNDGGAAAWLRRLGPREESLAVAPLPAMDFPPPPDARPATLADRQTRTCAWPLGPAERPGDAATLFCCAPLDARSPYCAVHAARSRRAPID
jgi:hypothetical protein